MKNTYKILLVLSVGTALQACALTPKNLKAPCGPSAGLTDPCGNRVPINKQFRPGFDGSNFEQPAARKPEAVQV